MEKKVLRAGIIGSGFAAKFHYDALQRVFNTKVEIAGAYSPTPPKLADFTASRNIPAYENIEQLIAASDVIHVCTPPVTHEPLVIAALQQDKYVIVEKPFTGYFGDGTDAFNGDTFPKEQGLEHAMQSVANMLNAEKASRGKIMYAENWVYAPAIQK